MLPPLDVPYDFSSNRRIGLRIVARLLGIALAAMYRNRERIRLFLIEQEQVELVELFDQCIEAIQAFLDSVNLVQGE